MISLPEQPLAERILRAGLTRATPPQQLLLFGLPGTGKGAAAHELAWALMDPDGTHERTDEALDLFVVEATGNDILLADLDPGLMHVAARPMVMRRRVLIIPSAERLSVANGADRILKTLEEPPPLATVILVTDRADHLIPTIRSRCLPVPFRSPGWSAIAARLVAQGEEPAVAGSRARAEGPRAVEATPTQRAMRRIGVELGLTALAGDGEAPGARVAAVQTQMEAAAAENPSDQLRRLRDEAAALDGKRGGRTAAKRAEDQEKRERRRLVTDGWRDVFASAAGVAADALALSVGAERAVRHTDRLDDLRAAAAPEHQEFLIRTIEELQLAVANLPLNPREDVNAEATLIRIELARHGQMGPLVPHGRPPA